MTTAIAKARSGEKLQWKRGRKSVTSAGTTVITYYSQCGCYRLRKFVHLGMVADSWYPEAVTVGARSGWDWIDHPKHHRTRQAAVKVCLYHLRKSSRGEMGARDG